MNNSSPLIIYVLIVGVLIGWLITLLEFIILNPHANFAIGKWIIIPARTKQKAEVKKT